MADHPIVAEAVVSGEDIHPIILRLEDALDGTPKVHALIALTSAIILFQRPDITPDELYEGVREVSRFTSLWLTGVGSAAATEIAGELPDKSKMN